MLDVGAGMQMFGSSASAAAAEWHAAIADATRTGVIGGVSRVADDLGAVTAASSVARLDTAATAAHDVATGLDGVLPDRVRDSMVGLDDVVTKAKATIAPGDGTRNGFVPTAGIADRAATLGALVGVANLVDAHGGIDAVRAAGGIAALDDAGHAIVVAKAASYGALAESAAMELHAFTDDTRHIRLDAGEVASAHAALQVSKVASNVVKDGSALVQAESPAQPVELVRQGLIKQLGRIVTPPAGFHPNQVASSRKQALQAIDSLAEARDAALDTATTMPESDAAVAVQPWTSRTVGDAAEAIDARVTALAELPSALTGEDAVVDVAQGLRSLVDDLSMRVDESSGVDRGRNVVSQSMDQWRAASTTGLDRARTLTADLHAAIDGNRELRDRMPEQLVSQLDQLVMPDRATPEPHRAFGTVELSSIKQLAVPLKLVERGLPESALTHPARSAITAARAIVADDAGFTAGLDAVAAASTKADRAIAISDAHMSTVALADHVQTIGAGIESLRDTAEVARRSEALEALQPVLRSRVGALADTPAIVSTLDALEPVTTNEGILLWSLVREFGSEDAAKPLSTSLPSLRMHSIADPLQATADRLRRQTSDLATWKATGALPEAFDVAKNPELGAIVDIRDRSVMHAAGASADSATAPGAVGAMFADLGILATSRRMLSGTTRVLPEEYPGLITDAVARIPAAWNGRAEAIDQLVAEHGDALPESILNGIEHSWQRYMPGHDALSESPSVVRLPTTGDPTKTQASLRVAEIGPEYGRLAQLADQPASTQVHEALARGRALLAEPATGARQRTVLGHAAGLAEVADELVTSDATPWRLRRSAPIVQGAIDDIDAAMASGWRQKDRWQDPAIRARTGLTAMADHIDTVVSRNWNLRGTQIEADAHDAAQSLDTAHVRVSALRGGLPTGDGAADLAEQVTQKQWPSDRRIDRARKRLEGIGARLDKPDHWWNPTWRTRSWMRAVEDLQGELRKAAPVVPDDIGAKINTNSIDALQTLDTSRRAFKAPMFAETHYPDRSVVGRARADVRTLDAMLAVAKLSGKPDPIVTSLDEAVAAGVDAGSAANYVPDAI